MTNALAARCAAVRVRFHMDGNSAFPFPALPVAECVRDKTIYSGEVRSSGIWPLANSGCRVDLTGAYAALPDELSY